MKYTLRNPAEFRTNLAALEDVEKSITRLVSYAMWHILGTAIEQFDRVLTSTAPIGLAGESVGDRANYLGEDLTRMALDMIGMPRVPGGRLFGTIDYKAATVAFMPQYAVEVALLVDSKAEKKAFNVARVQITQTSLEVRQKRSGDDIRVPGLVDKVWEAGDHRYLTSTLFVKYHYSTEGPSIGLNSITVAALPHGYLQDKYSKSSDDNIWNAGPDAPSLGERFRTRLNFTKLELKAPWRVQRIKPESDFYFKG